MPQMISQINQTYKQTLHERTKIMHTNGALLKICPNLKRYEVAVR